MEEQLARLGSKEAKAEAIQTRQVEVLESSRYDDPIQYLTFMDRINKTINDYMAERDSEKYLSEMEKMAEDYREGRSTMDYPELIADDGAAKTFYGSINSGAKKATGSPPNDSLKELLGQLALEVKTIVAENAKRDWRDNVVVHRNIKKHLDDVIFDFIEDNKLSWSLDAIDIIIDEIMMAAKKVY
jgi:type I restriction enzyme R subunit